MFDVVGMGSAVQCGPADAGLLADLEAGFDPWFDEVRDEDYAEDLDAAPWPPYDDTGVLGEIIADLDREVARTRAELRAVVVDRDEARARAEVARVRSVSARAAAEQARIEVAAVRHQVVMARAETVRAIGERGLARADLDAVRDARPDPGQGLVARLTGPPGPDLADAVDALVGDLAITAGSGPAARLGCVDGLSDDEVVSLVVAAQRVAAWAGAAQLATAGHLRERWAATPLSGNDEALWITACEIALATGLTRHAAADHLAAAQDLPIRVPEVWDRLVAGRLDLAKAVLASEKTQGLAPAVVAVVQTGLVEPLDRPQPPTRPQLAALLDRLIAAANPAAAEETARACRAHRGVAFRALPHGMGQMTLTSGAEEIEAARAALNALTHTARGRGRRDDPDNPSAPCDPDGRHPDATRADVLIDLITAADADAPAAGAETRTDTPPGRTRADTPPGRGPGRRRAEIVVLVPLSVLTGQSEAPATLAGYGPIPAQPARDLAATGTWRCAAIDDRDDSPTHATLLGLGRSTYTPAYSPGPGLRRFIELRDGTCTFPGCRHPATRSELDHRIPWQTPDPSTPNNPAGDAVTCDCNLHTLCPHHHRLKHRGGLTARPAPGGATTWTTPTGRTHTTRPDPLL